MRNLQRHKVVVARQEGANEADITYYHVDMFVQAPKLDDTTIIQNDGSALTSLTEWVKTFCAQDFPKTQIVEEQIRYDAIYWEGKWFRPLEQSNFVKMGNKSYFERYCYYSSSFNSSIYQTPPPAFESEYVDFLDAVGQTTMAVEIPLTSLKNSIDKCKQ